MTDTEKLKNLAEAMDVPVEEIHETDELTENLAWDSIATLSFMTVLASEFGRKITQNELKNITTVRDALDLMRPSDE